MKITLENGDAITPTYPNNHKDLIKKIGKDAARFVLARGLVVSCFNYAFVLYANENFANRQTSSDLAVITVGANMMRELLNFASNIIKDAQDAKDTQKLADLHLVTILCGANALIGTVIINQTYTLILPLMGRNNDQTATLPLLTTPVTASLMLLTSEYIYGSIRNPKATMWQFIASGPVIIGLNYGFRQINTTAIYFYWGQGIQCSLYVLGSWAYLEYAHREEHLFKKLWEGKKYKEGYLQACKINIMGIKPAAILLSEFLSTILINGMLAPRNLAAFQIMSSAIVGLGNAMCQTLQQRIQVQSKECLNTIKDDPERLKSTLQRLLAHYSWMSMVIPLTTGCAAYAAQDFFIQSLYDPKPDEQDIAEEAKRNILLVFLNITLRFLSTVPSGFIFAVRNTDDPFHHKLNNYLSLVRILNPIALFGLGLGIDSLFQMGSTSYWISGAITLSIANVINAAFAWQLINYLYQSAKVKLEKDQLASLPSYNPTFWTSPQVDLDPEIENGIPLQEVNALEEVDSDEELLLAAAPTPVVSQLSMFARSRQYLSEKLGALSRPAFQ